MFTLHYQIAIEQLEHFVEMATQGQSHATRQRTLDVLQERDHFFSGPIGDILNAEKGDTPQVQYVLEKYQAVNVIGKYL